ncbi:MAG: glycoside hydrolase family 5 protein [Gemmatimonadaceae bacterium]|nr:glycoside hydrolase family 5 protein [Gemmatimonadaceae bacterium]
MSRRPVSILLPLLLPLLAACGDGGAATQPVPVVTPVIVHGDAATVARELGRGVNLGNALEGPSEGAWGVRLSDALFDAAKASGATTIRLPVRFSNHAAATAPYALDEAFMLRVDWAVDAALARGLRIVLDMHHHRQLDGDALDAGEFAVAPAVIEARFVAIWRQLATRYRSRPVTVLFELYNEPHGDMTAARWNMLLAQALAAIRAVDTARYVVIGPVGWNNASQLDNLALPSVDQRLLVTIHNYEPFTFTHQGAGWVGLQDQVGVTCCSLPQLAQLEAPLDRAQRWREASGRPVWIGEFGSYDRGPYASRVAYTRAFRTAMESRGMTWAYWEFAAGFGFFDPATGDYRVALRDALFGE